MEKNDDQQIEVCWCCGLKKNLYFLRLIVFLLIQDSQKSSTLTEIEGKKFYLGTLDPGTEKKKQ